MGGNGGCGCGAVGGAPCRCEHPATPPPNGMPRSPPVPGPRPRGPAAAPGTPRPYTRFDLFEEARRRGMPVAFPADPSRPPPPDPRAERLRALSGPPVVLEPAAHPAADGRQVVQPRFDAPAPWTAEDGPVAPEGAPLDIERFFDVASPEGVVVPFEMAWPGDMPAPRGPARDRIGTEPPAPVQPGRDALQPPEYLSRIGGPEERELLESPPAEEPKLFERPEPPDPPGFASPQEPRGNEPRAPGQQACTEDAFAELPRAEFTPQPPGAGGGGGGAAMETVGLNILWFDPCPCKCRCVRVAGIISLFIEAFRLAWSFFENFGRDTSSVLSASAAPAIVVATPDGFVEQVRDLLARRDVVAYGTPVSIAPGGAAPAAGLSPTFAARAPPTPFAQRLLWPELDGTLAAETRVVAPVGPGPGIPGIGSEPLVPASGATFRAAPGSLFAGIAPARDGFGPDMRGRP